MINRIKEPLLSKGIDDDLQAKDHHCGCSDHIKDFICWFLGEDQAHVISNEGINGQKRRDLRSCKGFLRFWCVLPGKHEKTVAWNWGRHERKNGIGREPLAKPWKSSTSPVPSSASRRLYMHLTKSCSQSLSLGFMEIRGPGFGLAKPILQVIEGRAFPQPHAVFKMLSMMFADSIVSVYHVYLRVREPKRGCRKKQMQILWIDAFFLTYVDNGDTQREVAWSVHSKKLKNAWESVVHVSCLLLLPTRPSSLVNVQPEKC